VCIAFAITKQILSSSHKSVAIGQNYEEFFANPRKFARLLVLFRNSRKLLRIYMCSSIGNGVDVKAATHRGSADTGGWACEWWRIVYLSDS
jgi:hypothetical protein